MFRLENVTFEYQAGVKALSDVSLHIPKGCWAAIIGANGSGKSTLARHLNGLLTATGGRVLVDGVPVEDYANIQQLRRKVGIVFQNPDNQIVGNSVEEDVAFGPENLGVSRPEMRRRITEVLGMVGLSGRETADPNTLSGGQKQRLAIAGALAMQPEALILDEATSMLDPVGVAEVMEVLRRLHAGGMTIVMITHSMAEVAEAELAVVMANGRLKMAASPAEVFRQEESLAKWHIEVPPVTRLGNMLGISGCLNFDELMQRLDGLAGRM